LYAFQMKSNLKNGLKMNTGMDIKQTYDSIIHFYTSVFKQDAAVREMPDSNTSILEIKVPDEKTIIRNVMVSPRGNDVAYVEWEEGEYHVYIQNTRGDQKKTVIVSGGRKNYLEEPDPDYPILAWSNNGFKLGVLYQRKNQIRLKIFDAVNSRVQDHVIRSSRFDRVLGMTFMEDDQKMVISAMKRGQTDLYEFRIKGSRLTRITNDAWDDVQPLFISGGARRGVVFLSNRPVPDLTVQPKVNELPTGPMNAFFYDTKTKSTSLLQLTNVDKGNVDQPIQYGSYNFAFLYDSNGVVNKFVV